ncbi:glycosyltransferase family 2 protein [Terasakiella pusilla]|uniref:glycosyltransferase family 2 protein n=1 Tax=Terasakiella pusilla TaxID=64973 RepID=UPI003AA8AF1D
MARPLISVLMSTYNDEKYIEKAINSILAQTMSDFEIIIVNDASTDSTPCILARLQSQDERIKLIENTKNLGLTKSLNIALEHCQGSYIARMDSDDISLPHRFERQLRCFQNNPSVVLLGSNVRQIDKDGKLLNSTQLPLQDQQIRSTCLFLNPFAHPTIMLRAEVLQERKIKYDVSFDTSQDWELWTRLLKYGNCMNIEESLVYYRVHSGSVSARKAVQQRKNTLRVQNRYIAHILPNYRKNDEFLDNILKYILGNSIAVSEKDLKTLEVICLDVLNFITNVKRARVLSDVRYLERFVVWRVLRSMIRNRSIFFLVLKKILTSHFSSFLYAPIQGVRAFKQRIGDTKTVNL